MKLSVISPTFNEAENVPRLIEQLEKALNGIDYEIVIVDDNSPDRTWSVAEEISASNPRVRTLRRMENPGLGKAVIDGFSIAKGDTLACIDADLQHDPSILPKMLEEMEKGHDVVVGSRYVNGGSTGSWNVVRRAQSVVATKLAQSMLGLKLSDPMSGYFLVSRGDFTTVKDRLNGNGFKIFLEIIAKLRPSKVKEVPYTFRSRTAGESKLSTKVVFHYVHQLWRLSGSNRRLSDQALKFGIVGSLGVLVNLLVMTLLLNLTGIVDWRASAIASMIANLHNYILNNGWTFADRAHRGARVVKGYCSFVLMSAVGLAVTTAAYAGLIYGANRLLPSTSSSGYALFVRLGCQLVSVLMGVYFNYQLNKGLTWPPLRAALRASSTVLAARGRS